MRTLVLGAGKSERIEGAIHHDIIQWEGIEYGFDLNGSWPEDFRRNKFDRVVANHLVEHLQSLIYFLNACHEIINPGGLLEIETPNAGVNFDLTHCDPSHTRCYRKHTFINYFTPEGIAKFGYTDKAWEIKEIYTKRIEISDDTIVVKLSPIKCPKS